MQWSVVKVVPTRFRHKCLRDMTQYYRFELPIIADGRLAHLQLRLNPEKAIVWRLDAGRPVLRGSVRLIDNQWSCVWDQNPGQKPGNLRILAGRFGMGDIVGLRPAGGALGLFVVYTVTPAALELTDQARH
jgi:hypothetical protein